MYSSQPSSPVSRSNHLPSCVVCFVCVARLLQALMRNWEVLYLFSFACVGQLPSRVWLLQVTQGCSISPGLVLLPDALEGVSVTGRCIWLTRGTASHDSHLLRKVLPIAAAKCTHLSKATQESLVQCNG